MGTCITTGSQPHPAFIVGDVAVPYPHVPRTGPVPTDPYRRFAAFPQAVRRREWLPSSSAPNVPFCAAATLAAGIVLARYSAPERV